MNGKDFKKEASEIFSFPLLKAMEENKSSEINLFQIGVELNIIRKRINENQ